MVSGADIMIHGSWDVHPSTQGGDGLQLIIIVAGTTHGTIPGIMAITAATHTMATVTTTAVILIIEVTHTITVMPATDGMAHGEATMDGVIRIMATEGVVTTPMAVTQVRPTTGDAAMAATVEALKEEDPMGISLAIVALQAQCHKATQVNSAVIPYQTEAT